MNAMQELREALEEYEFRGTDGAAGRLAEAARALKQAPPAAAVLEGYAPVPVEPTEAMLTAADVAFDNWWGGESEEPSFVAAYRAMLAAANKENNL